MSLRSTLSSLATALCAASALVACAAQGGTSTTTDTALTDALQSAMTSSGALACAPTTDQVAACTGKAALDALP